MIAYTTDKLYQAEIIKEILIDNHIRSIIMNKKDSAYNFGEIEIYVKANNIIKAKQLINEFEN